MKAIRNGMNFIYTLYAIVVFTIPIPFVLLFHGMVGWMKTQDRLRWVYKSHRVWIGLWEFLTGVDFEVEGMENVDPEQAYVFVVNHNNMLDILSIGSYLIHPWKSLIKKEIKKVPLIGFLIGLIAIPVDRSNKESRKQSLIDMVKHIKDGISILIFPEGTRNRTNTVLKRFYPGAFAVAIKAQVPIVPIVICNHRHLQPVNKLRLHPGKGNIIVLPPVSTEGLEDADVQTLNKQVHQRMYDAIVAHDKLFEEQIPETKHNS